MVSKPDLCVRCRTTPARTCERAALQAEIRTIQANITGLKQRKKVNPDIAFNIERAIAGKRGTLLILTQRIKDLAATCALN